MMIEDNEEKEVEITFKNFTRLYITTYRVIIDKNNLNSLEIFDINNKKMFYINSKEIMYYSIKLKEETNG